MSLINTPHRHLSIWPLLILTIGALSALTVLPGTLSTHTTHVVPIRKEFSQNGYRKTKAASSHSGDNGQSAAASLQTLTWPVWSKDAIGASATTSFSFTQTATSCTPPPSGMVSWWPGDGNADDIIGGNNGALINNPTFTSGNVGQSFNFSGRLDRVTIPNNSSLDFTTADDYTIDLWLRTWTDDSYLHPALVEKWNDTTSSGYPYAIRINTGAFGPSGTIFVAAFDGTDTRSVNSNKRVDDGSWHHVAALFRHSQKRIEVYIDGQFDNGITYTTLGQISNGLPVTLGIRPASSPEREARFDYIGLLDDVGIFNRALSAPEIKSIYNAGSDGICKPGVIPTSTEPILSGFTITPLNTLGGNFSWAFDINNQGQVAGYSAVLDGRGISAFLADAGGCMTDLGKLNNEAGMALGINDSGHVVGKSCDFDACLASIYTPEDGIVKIPHVAGTTAGEGWDVNDSDVICGKVYYEDGSTKPFIYDRNNGMKVINLPEWGDGLLYRLNNSRQAVGWAYVSNSPRAFTYTEATGVRYIDAAHGLTPNYAYGINESGQIALTSSDSSGRSQACLLDPVDGQIELGRTDIYTSAEGLNDFGQVVGSISGRAMVYDRINGMKDLNNLIPQGTGWTLQKAVAINNRGQITGYGSLNGSIRTGFLLTPRTAPLVIQQQLQASHEFNANANALAQTFTPTRSGKATRLTVKTIGFYNGVRATVTARLYQTNSPLNASASNLLASSDAIPAPSQCFGYAPDGTSGRCDVTLTFPNPPSLQAGQTYLWLITIQGMSTNGWGTNISNTVGGPAWAQFGGSDWYKADNNISSSLAPVNYYFILSGETPVTGPPPDFTISAEHNAQTISQGTTATFPITIQSVNGLSSPVSLYALNLPPGLVAQGTSWSPQTVTPSSCGMATSVLSIATNGTTQTGTFPIILRAVSGGIAHEIPVTLTIGTGGDFTISVTPPARNITQGDSATFTLTLTSQNGFSSPISIYPLNLPPGYVAQGTALSDSTVTPPANGSATTTLTILTGGSTQTGTFPITLRGVGSGLTHETSVELTIVPLPNNAFTLSATPVKQVVSQGGEASFTVTVMSQNGFSGPVSMSTSTLPPGYALQGTGWTQRTVTPPANGTVDTTLTIATNGLTQFGTFPITLRGVSGGLKSEAPVWLTITGNSSRPIASFNFSPASPMMNQTTQFTDTSSGSALSWGWDFDGNGSVDSTERNPTHQFSTAGTRQVSLTVKSPYGSDTYAQDVQVIHPGSGNAPYITNVKRQYPGVFLQGGHVDLRFDVGVDWKGSAGKVLFSINGGPVITEPGNIQGASHTFVINRDLVASSGPSVIQITPVNAAGVPGETTTEYVFVYGLPTWLQKALTLDSNALQWAFGPSNFEYKLSVEFPIPHLYGIIPIPDEVPYLGGRFGLLETFVRADGKITPATGKGSFGAGFTGGFTAMGAEIGLGASVRGNVQLTAPTGLIVTDGALKLKLEGTLSREENILSAIPSLRPLLRFSPIKRLSDNVKLRMELTPSIDTTFSFKQNNSGDLAFNEGTAELGLETKVILKAGNDYISARAWASGGGKATIGRPDPFLRRLQINAQVGVSFSFTEFFKITEEAKCDFGVAWTPDTGVHTFFCGSGDNNSQSISAGKLLSSKLSATGTGIPLTLIKPAYVGFGKYNSFGLKPKSQRTVSLVPASVQDAAIVTNVFPGASPKILEVGAGRLLLWEHQVSTLPVPQSTDIAWSYNNGNGWSTTAFIKQDTQAEISPTAGVDANGNVVAAWLRIKDTDFSTPVNTSSDLPLFYKRLEVVTSVFNPSGQTWGSVTPLTDDAAFDTDLRLSSDQSGHLMLTWLSNPDGEFVSTAASPSVLKYSFWNGEAWSAPAPLANGLVGVGGQAAAIYGNRAFVIVARDPDPATDGDDMLDLYTWDGSQWSEASTFAAGGGANRLPAAVYDVAGESHIVWSRGDDLVHATLSDHTPVLVRAGSSSLSFSDAKLLVNPQGNLTLLWQQAVDNGPANIFAMLYDPLTRTWSADRRLNVDAAMNYDVDGYYGRDNQLHATYLSTEINRTSETISVDGEPGLIENIPQTGRADLRVFDHSLIIDLAVMDSDLSVTPQTPREGDSVTATLSVHNAGDFAVGNFLVSLYVGNPDAGGILVGTTNITDTLRAGDRKDVTFNFIYPAGGGNIVAVVDGLNNVAEFTKANNRATVYANNTAPQASITASVISGVAPLTVNFDSAGSLDSEGDSTTFSWSFADGTESTQAPQATHAFTQVGSFPVTLAVTDSRGAVGTAVVLITVAPSTLSPLQIDAVTPVAGRASGGQQIKLSGSFADLSTVTIGGVSATWTYTNGTSEITVMTPAHPVGAVALDLSPASGNAYSKSNAFAYLPTVFTDDTLVVRVTTAKAQHIIELRQAVDALRAVAKLQPVQWTDATLAPTSTLIKAVHVLELRTYLDEAMVRLGYSTQPYTDPSLTIGDVIKRVYIEELRQRIRAIAG